MKTITTGSPPGNTQPDAKNLPQTAPKEGVPAIPAIPVVSIQSNADLAESATIQNELRSIQEKENHSLILDLSELESIDAAGLRFLAEVNARAHSRGGRVVCVCADPGIRLVMRETNLDRFLQLTLNMDLAREVFA